MKTKYYIIFLCLIASKFHAQKKDFKVYDAIMFANKPDLYKEGLSKINMIYEDSILSYNAKFPKVANERLLDYAKLKRTFGRVDVKYPICLDIESWNLNRKSLQKSVPKYVKILQNFNKNFPKSDIGLYGVLPYADLNLYMDKAPFNKNKSQNWNLNWNIINNNLGAISKNSTVAYPSCYTRSKDKNLWLSAFLAQINQIKKINPSIKINAFLWPQYYAPGSDYNDQEIDKDFWNFQLETAYKYCDAIVIWASPFKTKNREINIWNSKSDWWLATKNFIENKNIKSNYYAN